MKTIDKITFISPINVDYGYVNIPQGEMKSTMELISFDQGDCIPELLQIVWYVEKLDKEVVMDIDYEGKNVTGYDGVFELPEQAIQLLEKNGFNCEQVKVLD